MRHHRMEQQLTCCLGSNACDRTHVGSAHECHATPARPSFAQAGRVCALSLTSADAVVGSIVWMRFRPHHHRGADIDEIDRALHKG